MIKELNWYKFLPQLGLLLIAVFLISAQQNSNVIGKLGKKLSSIDGFTKHYLVFGDIGTPFPCGDMMAVSIEDDDRYFFCKSSHMNATLAPDGSMDIPGDGIGANKAETSNEPTKKSYIAAYHRINQLTLGIHQDGASQKRWGIDKNQLIELYPENTFEVALGPEDNRESGTAFDPSNLFYEMLIGVQQLSQENAELKLRLQQIEHKLGLTDIEEDDSESNQNNYVKALQNPSSNNNFGFEYSIDSQIQNAQLYLFDINGKLLQNFILTERGNGINNRSIDLAAGTYFYQLVIDQTRLQSQKLIVQ